MNKHFKKLADQAGFVRFSYQEDPRTSIDWSCDYSMELNRFAELIIKQCSLAVQDFVDHRIPASEYPNKLKHHFGVKE